MTKQKITINDLRDGLLVAIAKQMSNVKGCLFDASKEAYTFYLYDGSELCYTKKQLDDFIIKKITEGKSGECLQ